jgi:membrane protein YqaA with SNARE-associated domain
LLQFQLNFKTSSYTDAQFNILAKDEGLLFYFITLLEKSWTQLIIQYLRGLGIFGPFVVETLDTSFFYLPFATEVLLFVSVRAHRESFFWIIYVVLAALGSTVGVLMLDIFARKIGEEGLEKFVKPNKLQRLKSKLQTHSGWTLFVVSLMPPTFPFRLVMITASALQNPRKNMLIAVFSGRLVRFTCEALLILYFGQKFLTFIGSQTAEYIVFGLIIIAALGSIFIAYKLISNR